MPNDHRFDDLDLREEPSSPSGHEPLQVTFPNICPTTTVLPTHDC